MALPGIACPARGGKHESLFGLINMNGRFYDPRIGRFLSPDNGDCPVNGGVQMSDFTQNFNRYSYCLNNPLVFTDPSGEVVFLIGFIVGAYIGGAWMNDWKMNPAKWDYKSSNTWVGMIGGCLIGGFAASMGWYALTTNYAFNINVGISGLQGAFQGGAQFLVSNSGIIFQGLGYATAAGGGAFLTHEAIKGLNNRDVKVERPRWSEKYFQESEDDAKELLLESSRLFNVETTYWSTSKGYYFEPIQGNAYGYSYDPISLTMIDYNVSIGYQSNTINSTYRYTYVENLGGNLYLSPSIFELSLVYNRAHTHPKSSPPSASDLTFSYLFGIPCIVFGWNGSVYKYGGNGYWR